MFSSAAAEAISVLKRNSWQKRIGLFIGPDTESLQQIKQGFIESGFLNEQEIWLDMIDPTLPEMRKTMKALTK